MKRRPLSVFNKNACPLCSGILVRFGQEYIHHTSSFSKFLRRWIKRKAREQGLSAKQRYELRLDESLPILNALGTWMAEQVRTTLPKSPFGKALIYSILRWDNLMAYLKDGHLEIDNNLVENAIRPNALGRKNHLFAGYHAGAQKAAMFYSFFGTCKMNQVDPFIWFKTVLEIIPDYPANKLVDLLPQNLDLQKYS